MSASFQESLDSLVFDLVVKAAHLVLVVDEPSMLIPKAPKGTRYATHLVGATAFDSAVSYK
jgi:hypothetical protein